MEKKGNNNQNTDKERPARVLFFLEGCVRRKGVAGHRCGAAPLEPLWCKASTASPMLCCPKTSGGKTFQREACPRRSTARTTQLGRRVSSLVGEDHGPRTSHPGLMLPLLSLRALSMETMLFRTGLIGPHAYTAPSQEKPEPSGTWAGGTKKQAKARVAPCEPCQRELIRDARADMQITVNGAPIARLYTNIDLSIYV